MAEVYIIGYQHYSFAQSLVVGEIVPQEFCLDLNECEGLIFTSKNAIYSLESNAKTHSQMQIWKAKPSYSIGKATSKTLLELGGNLAYTSNSAHGDEFAKELSEVLTQGKKYFYFRAKEIVSNLDSKLSERGFDITPIIAYKSKAIPLQNKLKPPKHSTLLFTSPSAYKYFLQSFEWDESYKAVALGKTTYESFDSEILKEISPIQDIRESVKLLQTRFGD